MKTRTQIRKEKTMKTTNEIQTSERAEDQGSSVQEISDDRKSALIALAAAGDECAAADLFHEFGITA